MRQLRNREGKVGDTVGCALRIHHLQVEHTIDPDLDVVARDADLFRDVEGQFLEAVFVGRGFDERD